MKPSTVLQPSMNHILLLMTDGDASGGYAHLRRVREMSSNVRKDIEHVRRIDLDCEDGGPLSSPLRDKEDKSNIRFLRQERQNCGYGDGGW